MAIWPAVSRFPAGTIQNDREIDMKLTKNTVYILVAAVAALAVLLVVLLSGGKKTAETVHRQNENQIVAFRDSSRVEYYYENPEDSGPVDLQLQLIIDGPYTVAEATLLPGETGTLTQTLRGEPYTPFVPNVYTGRILVFDHETGRLKERVYGLEFRLNDSDDDPNDALQPAPAPEAPVQSGEKIGSRCCRRRRTALTITRSTCIRIPRRCLSACPGWTRRRET